MSDKDLIAALKRRHEDHQGPLGCSWWRLVRDAYGGTGGFRVAVERARVDERGLGDYSQRQIDAVPGSYLRRFGRESVEAFAERQRVSFYRNHIRTVVSQYQGQLWRRAPQRESTIASVSSWWESVDGTGTPIAKWLAVGSRRAQLFGWAAAYFDRPRGALTLANARTAARWLQPEELVDWQIGEDGSFEWAKLCTEVETRDPLSGDETEVEVYTIWTRTTWRSITLMESGDECIIAEDSGPMPHALGAVPLAVLYWQPPECRDELFGTSHLDSAISAALELFNVSSEARYVERGTAFPVLYIQSSDPNVLASLRLGVNNGLVVEPTASMPPGFMVVPPELNTHFKDRRAELRDEIYQAANLDPPAAQVAPPESGVARAYKFLPRRAVLVDVTEQLAAFERKCVEILARWDGAVAPEAIAQWQAATRVQYATDFDVQDASTTIEQGASVLDRNDLAPVTRRTARLAIGRAVAPQPTPTDEAALVAQVEQLYQREVSALDRPSPPLSPPPAAPAAAPPTGA